MPLQRHQGHIARKRFGQNFLVDRAVIDEIVNVIAPRPGDRMVEIGPGLGALTAPLIARLGVLHAVELDRDLIARLAERFGDTLALHSGDALAFDFRQLLATPAPAAASLRIVGNLPYNISTPLLFHLSTFAELIIDQHFMLQSEVVDRMTAEPGGKEYGRLSVMLQYRYLMDRMVDVPPGSFEPAPKVGSAIVRMIPHPVAELPQVDAEIFGRLVTAAFSQRRKMLRNTLAVYRDQVDFEALGFGLSRRAEEVPVAEYVGLARALAGGG